MFFVQKNEVIEDSNMLYNRVANHSEESLRLGIWVTQWFSGKTWLGFHAKNCRGFCRVLLMFPKIGGVFPQNGW